VGEGAPIGIDLGGTKVYGAVVGRDGSIGHETYAEHGAGVPSPATGSDEDLERTLGPAYACVVDTARDLMARARAAGQEPVGIGVGAPGITRPDGVVVLAGGLGWRDVPLGPLLERRLGLPVRVENDVNLAALGESSLGAGRDKSSMFLMAVGTSIGGAVVLDGRLWRGRHLAAGEIGALLPGAEYLSWDNREIGALETYASGAGLAAEARRLATAAGCPYRDEDGRGEKLFAHAAAGQPWARQVVDRAVDLWTVALAAVQTVLDPEVIVLSGGVALSAAAHLPEIARRLERALPAVSAIVPSILGYRAAVLGVPALFR
jgi:glucokinase